MPGSSGQGQSTMNETADHTVRKIVNQAQSSCIYFTSRNGYDKSFCVYFHEIQSKNVWISSNDTEV